MTSQLGDAERSVSIKQKHELGFVIYLRGANSRRNDNVFQYSGFSVQCIYSGCMTANHQGGVIAGAPTNTHTKTMFDIARHACVDAVTGYAIPRDAMLMLLHLRETSSGDGYAICMCVFFMSGLYDKSRFFVVDN